MFKWNSYSTSASPKRQSQENERKKGLAWPLSKDGGSDKFRWPENGQKIGLGKFPLQKWKLKPEPSIFPPANARFSYVSGEEISINQIKTLAAESIMLIQLAPGEALTDCHRQVLKSDTI